MEICFICVIIDKASYCWHMTLISTVFNKSMHIHSFNKTMHILFPQNNVYHLFHPEHLGQFHQQVNICIERAEELLSKETHMCGTIMTNRWGCFYLIRKSDPFASWLFSFIESDCRLTRHIKERVSRPRRMIPFTSGRQIYLEMNPSNIHPLTSKCTLSIFTQIDNITFLIGILRFLTN